MPGLSLNLRALYNKLARFKIIYYFTLKTSYAGLYELDRLRLPPLLWGRGKDKFEVFINQLNYFRIS